MITRMIKKKEAKLSTSLRRVVCISIVLALATIGSHALAQQAKSDAISITNAWTRVTPPGAKVAAGFLTITNNGSKPETLVSATTPIAGRVEIHSMTMSNGMMKMRALDEGLEIKPGQSVTLKPGGLHLMFLDLKQSPKNGGSVAGTLNFKNLGKLDVTYAVKPLGARSFEAESAN